LMMAYKGSRENEVAEMALRYGRQYPMFLEQAAVYHARAMGDVMTMHGFGPEVYRPLVDMKALVHFLGEHALIEEIGTERIIQEIGEERFIQEIGKERLLQDLLAKLGPEKSREILERATRTQADEKG